MSAVRIQGGAEVLSGSIGGGLVGLWTAEVELDTDEPPAVGETVTVELLGADGTAVGYRGTVRTSGEYHARARVFLVAGSGGLGGVLPAQHYNGGPTALQLVEDLLTAAGEALSGTVDRALLASLTQPSWMRIEMAGTDSLSLIAEAFGWDWRALPDGTIWIGARVWTETRARSLYDTGADPAAPEVEYADGETLAPGQSIQGRPIFRVEHEITSKSVRTLATFDRDEREDWRGAVRGAEPSRLYRGRYGARVVSQNADGTLELLCDDERLGGLSRVPIRYGLPGCSALVPQGARMRVAFEASDPARAYASEWDAGTVTRLRLDGTSSYAGAAMSRVGDTVEVARLLWDSTTFTLWIASGNPAGVGGLYVYSMAVLVPGGSVVGIAANPNTPLPPTPGTQGTAITGRITSGNTEALA